MRPGRLSLVLILVLAGMALHGLEYGPVVGLGATWLEGEDLHGDHVNAGFAGGVAARFDLGGRFHLRPELLFVQKSAYS